MSTDERNALVVENLPLVGYLVSDLCARASHLDRDDLASCGAIALISAAESYRAEFGVPFGAFARRRITGALADELRAGDWATRGARRRIRETLAVSDQLTASLGRTPTAGEIAQALGVSQEVAEAGLADAARVVTPLDEVTADLLIADTALPDESLLEQEKLGYLRAAVDALPERMRHIVTEVYFGDRSVGEVADELGVTHSAVSQQRTQAMRLLGAAMSMLYPDDVSEAQEISVADAVEARQRIKDRRTSAAMRHAYLARVSGRVATEMSRMTGVGERRPQTVAAIAS